MGDIGIKGGTPKLPPTEPTAPAAPTAPTAPSTPVKESPKAEKDAFELKEGGGTKGSNTSNFASFHGSSASKPEGELKASALQHSAYANPRGDTPANSSDAKASASEGPKADYKGIKESLSTNIFKLDFNVSDKDIDSVHNELDKLPSKEYKETLDKMQKDGSLKTYVDEMDDKQMLRFAKQAHSKGAIEATSPYPAVGANDKISESGKERPLNPPDRPSMYYDKGQYPAMDKGLKRANNEVAKNYNKSYDAYKERYQGALKDIRQQAEDSGNKGEALRKLRDLGAPAKRTNYHNGIEQRSTQDPDLARDIDVTHSRILGHKPAGLGVNFKVGKVDKNGRGVVVGLGKDTAGDLTGEVTGKGKIGDTEIEATVKGSHRDGEFRDMEGKGKVVSKHIEAEFSTKGEGHVKTPIGGVEVDEKGDMSKVYGNKDNHIALGNGKFGAKGTVGNNTAEAKINRKGDEVEIKGELDFNGTGGKVEGKTDPSKGTATIGGEMKAGGFVVGGGADLKGIDPKTAHRSSPAGGNRWPGVHGVPSELQSDIPWEQLPPETQKLYNTELGWNRDEWEAHRKAR